MTASTHDFRDDLIDHLRRHVVGPLYGDGEEIVETPSERYLMGKLYPYGSPVEAAEHDLDEQGDAAGTDELPDDPVLMSNEYLPASMGSSFRVHGDPKVRIAVSAAVYEERKAEGRRRTFVHRPLATTQDPLVVELERPAFDQPVVNASRIVLEECLRLHVRWRARGSGWLVTVTAINNAELSASPDSPGPQDPARRPPPVKQDKCLFQVAISCSTPNGDIVAYPSTSRVIGDAEDEELALLYRDNHVFAIGHGASVRWSTSAQRSDDGLRAVAEVSTEMLPVADVPAITQLRESAPEALSLDFLADEERSPADLCDALRRFVSEYEVWRGELPSQHEDIPEYLHDARARLLSRIDEAAARMHAGIELLEGDAEVLRAFRLANAAMGMQMRHGRSDLAGMRHMLDGNRVIDADWRGQGFRWYPFQLAFQLLSLPGIADPGSADRELVDLIWFPTGGGKTEAYLAVAAATVILRRLRHRDEGGGTTILTRYTLRLLTTQQFQRAATLVCALELMRRGDPATFGRDPISIGLWVGGAVTPNTFQQAIEQLGALKDKDRPGNPFQLESCPWCGTEVIPEVLGQDDSLHGVVAGNDRFTFRCPESRCAFHDEIPVAVVDEEIYARPSTIVIGTVDKFARLAWEAKAGAIFGSSGCRGPELIIQDELHLLSGPLGSMVGLYESAIDSLIRMHGGRPKVIASTATIRRADEQVRRVFGTDVKLFPPSGLGADDSFFARTDRSRLGRRYVGIMAPSHPDATADVYTSNALLLAPQELSLDDDQRDGLWTLVAYHNTLWQLGRALTQYRDDVPLLLQRYSKDQSRAREMSDEAVVELTSNVSAAELPSILGRLTKSAGDASVIDVLVTTSMLSVGVDVSRLALMLVNGQPKTTAEYIQATSRVGRGGVPGTVVTLFSSVKPRDRSHYEAFTAFHEALYRGVEPTSVTPFSVPARQRALAGALVLLVRHGTGLSHDEAAAQFDPALPEVERAVSLLKSRAAAADPDSADATSRQVDAYVAEWHERARDCAASGRTLRYSVPQDVPQHPALLSSLDARGSGEGWATPNSMRSVDSEVRVDVPVPRRKR